MMEAKKVVFTAEDKARMAIRNFVNEGLKNVQDNNLYDFDEIFDEIENRYENA